MHELILLLANKQSVHAYSSDDRHLPVGGLDKVLHGESYPSYETSEAVMNMKTF